MPVTPTKNIMAKDILFEFMMIMSKDVNTSCTRLTAHCMRLPNLYACSLAEVVRMLSNHGSEY